MDSKGIRETYLSYFEGKGHRRMPSASLIPPPSDTSTLLTVAGMQPFKACFLGQEDPPASRLTSCQKCFRTPDIEEVGRTSRHLTCFEMLGNFSFGDYFKQEAIAYGWELSVEGFGFDPERIWVTVFGGDDELGLGPDTEAIELWEAQGMPRERIVELPRSENFWQAGPTGPCGPSSEMYLDRGAEHGRPGEMPGDDGERFLEYWNHVFMTYDLGQDGSLTPLPRQNIDTGLGLERMAAIMQGVSSVFETDLYRPLIELAEELSGRRYGESEPVTRAMRIVADHSRGMTFLLADGVVPSNEDRGYILRRVMRRAILQGRNLGFESPWLESFVERAIDIAAPAYPEVVAERDAVLRWARSEEESFGRTLARGTEILSGLVEAARQDGSGRIEAEDAFTLHDTYGFPIDLTRELAAEQGMEVDEEGFEARMQEQRRRARRGVETGLADEAGRRSAIASFATAAAPTRFVGFDRFRASTGVVAVEPRDGRALAKLEESPFYAEGGGQVSDAGEIRWSEGGATVLAVHRIGEDQAIEIAPAGDGERQGGADWLPEAGTRVEAIVDPSARHPTMRNHTATHLLHAALREIVGSHVRQAGSAVRPDKLRFDFTHGEPLTAEAVRAVEDRVNGWIADGRPVRWMHMDYTEAERLGAMALFGEKYGDWVRVVEVEDVSRELCGGTHVSNTAEVGVFRVLSEGSSSSNVRRIEAITGPAAIDWYRTRADEAEQAAQMLGTPGDPVAGAARLRERLEEMERDAERQEREQEGKEVEELASSATEVDGLKVVAGRAAAHEPKKLLEIANRLQSSLGEAAVALAGASAEKAGLVVLLSDSAVERGLSAAELVREIAPTIGGGGGGRDDMAQAGGRDPAGVDAAIEKAREEIQRALAA